MSRGSGYVLAQLGLLALVALGPRTLGVGADWPAPWALAARVAGVMLATAGVVLSMAGSMSLGRNLTPFPRPRKDATLVRSGPYRIVRHPIYAGLILLAFGWALFVNGGLTLTYALALAILLDVKTRFEERWLVATFTEYGEYQQRVAKLIPFLY